MVTAEVVRLQGGRYHSMSDLHDNSMERAHLAPKRHLSVAPSTSTLPDETAIAIHDGSGKDGVDTLLQAILFLHRIFLSVPCSRSPYSDAAAPIIAR